MRCLLTKEGNFWHAKKKTKKQDSPKKILHGALSVLRNETKRYFGVQASQFPDVRKEKTHLMEITCTAMTNGAKTVIS